MAILLFRWPCVPALGHMAWEECRRLNPLQARAGLLETKGAVKKLFGSYFNLIHKVPTPGLNERGPDHSDPWWGRLRELVESGPS